MIYEGSRYWKYIASGITSWEGLIGCFEEVLRELKDMAKDNVAACFYNADEGVVDFATDDPAIAAKYDMLEAEEDDEEVEDSEDDIEAVEDEEDPLDLSSVAKTAWDIVYGHGDPFHDRCWHCGGRL